MNTEIMPSGETEHDSIIDSMQDENQASNNLKPKTMCEKIMPSGETEQSSAVNNQLDANQVRKETIDQMMNLPRFTYEGLINLGFNFVCDSFHNRELNKAHQTNLEDELKNKCECLEPIQVFPYSEYEKHITHKQFVNVKGEPVIPDANSLVVEDGQHRVTAQCRLSEAAAKAAAEAKEAAEKAEKANAEEAEEAEAKAKTKAEAAKAAEYSKPLYVECVRIPTGMNPIQWFIHKNQYSKGWGAQDRAKHILSTRPDVNEVSNISVAVEWNKSHRLGERNAYAILNLDDTYKKADQLNYMLQGTMGGELPKVLKGTPEGIERGKKILGSFLVGFRTSPKEVKNMASIKMFIGIYKKSKKEQQTQVIEDLIFFFNCLTDEQVKLVSMEKSIDKKQDLLNKFWKKFSEEIKSDTQKNAYQEKAKNAEDEYTKICLEQEEKAKKKMSKKKKQ